MTHEKNIAAVSETKEKKSRHLIFTIAAVVENAGQLEYLNLYQGWLSEGPFCKLIYSMTFNRETCLDAPYETMSTLSDHGLSLNVWTKRTVANSDLSSAIRYGMGGGGGAGAAASVIFL